MFISSNVLRRYLESCAERTHSVGYCLGVVVRCSVGKQTDTALKELITAHEDCLAREPMWPSGKAPGQ